MNLLKFFFWKSKFVYIWITAFTWWAKCIQNYFNRHSQKPPAHFIWKLSSYPLISHCWANFTEIQLQNIPRKPAATLPWELKESHQSIENSISELNIFADLISDSTLLSKFHKNSNTQNNTQTDRHAPLRIRPFPCFGAKAFTQWNKPPTDTFRPAFTQYECGTAKWILKLLVLLRQWYLNLNCEQMRPQCFWCNLQ